MRNVWILFWSLTEIVEFYENYIITLYGAPLSLIKVGNLKISHFCVKIPNDSNFKKKKSQKFRKIKKINNKNFLLQIFQKKCPAGRQQYFGFEFIQLGRGGDGDIQKYFIRLNFRRLISIFNFWQIFWKSCGLYLQWKCQNFIKLKQ